MRYTISMLSILLLAGVAYAQHRPVPADSELNDAVQLQRRLQQSLLNNTAETNADIGRLRQQRESLADQTTILNNVISLRNRDELSQWVDDAKKRWNAESGPRIRIFNPYENSSYSRYYDENGNLMVSEVRNSYEWLQQQRQDWEKARKRAEQTVDSLEREYNDVAKKYGNVEAAQSKLAAELEAARRRANDFTGEKPNSVEGGNTAAIAPPQAKPAPAPAPKPQILSLSGRTGNGTWVVNGRTTYFTYEFRPGGTVIYRSNRENLSGTWTQSGSSVTVQVGQSYETGSISGNTLVLRCDTGNVGEGIATVKFD